MALPRWQGQVQDDAGNVLLGTTITVRREVTGAPLASLFADRDGATPKGNPFVVDADGFAAFHAAGGAYRIDAALGSFTRTWRYVALGLAAERDTIAPGVPFVFDDGVTDADPGAGAFRFNNATPGSATQLYISKTDADGVDVAAWLATFDDGGETTNRGTVTIDGGGQPRMIARVTGTIVDGTTYYKVPITPLAASTEWLAGTRVGTIFTSSGVDGADGVGTGDVVGPASSRAGQFALFGSATGKLLEAGVVGGASPIDELIIGNAEGVRRAVDGHVIHAGLLEEANRFEALTDGATVTLDWGALINAELVLAGNRTLANPLNVVPGTWRTICLSGSNATPRTIIFGNAYKNQPTIAVTITSHMILSLYARQADHIVCFASEAYTP